VKKIWAQAMKEFKLFRRDKLLIMLAVLMPVVMMYLAGSTASLRLRNIPLVVYDYDNTPLSRTYLETYGASLSFRIVPRDPKESPEQALASWRGRAALIIPQNFERDTRRGGSPIIQLLIDASDSNAATALGNYAQALNTSFAQKNAVSRAMPKLVSMSQRLWYNPGLSNPIYFGTGAMGLMLLLFPALLGALATAREYEVGTIIQAYASSLTAVQWILGKALLYVAIGIVNLVICFTLGLLIFDYRFPSDPSVLLVSTLLYLMAGVFFRNDDGELHWQPECGNSGRPDVRLPAVASTLRIPVCHTEHSTADSVAVELSASDLLHSDCSKFHSARRGMEYFADARSRIGPAGLWLLFSECHSDAQDAVQGIGDSYASGNTTLLRSGDQGSAATPA
jgi:ABC-2 type transport system permease protein